MKSQRSFDPAESEFAMKIRRLISALTMLWLLVLPSLASAEPQQECLKLRKIRTSYDGLEPGKGFELTLEFKSRSGVCALPLEVYGQTPTYKPSVQLDSASGLQAEWVGRSYGKLDDSHSAAHEMTLTFKVKAAPEQKPGEYSLTALIGYASVSREGRILPQQMSLRVPVRVVATGAKVKQPREDNWTPWELLLIPVRLVRGILEILSGPNLEGW